MKLKASDVMRNRKTMRAAAIAINELGAKTKDVKLLKVAQNLHKQARGLGTEVPETLGTNAPRKLGV